MDKEKVILVYSGGLDSTVLLYWLIDREFEPVTLTINYNQRHNKEIYKASEIAMNLGLQHKQLWLEELGDILDKSMPLSPIVPNRNMIMLSMAVAYAMNIGCTKVYFGAHSNDHAIHPDCRMAFVKSMQQTVRLATDNDNMTVIAPFINQTKEAIVGIGIELNVPFADTWSCHAGHDRPCLKCTACVDRAESFIKNNYKDPLLTNEEWSIYLKERGKNEKTKEA